MVCKIRHCDQINMNMCVVLYSDTQYRHLLPQNNLTLAYKYFLIYCTPQIQSEKQKSSPYPMQYHQRQGW